MKTKIMILLLAALFVAPSLLFAGESDIAAYKDQYYYAGAALGSYDPTSDDPNSATWNPNFTAGVPQAPVVLQANQVLVLAMRNILVKTNKKYLRVHAEYTGPVVQRQSVGFDIGVGGVVSETNAAGVYDLTYLVVPQPSWEYVVLRNPGPGTLTVNRATIESNCSPIPSLTPYGLLLLVLLVAGTSVWVLRRRQAVVSV